MPAIELAKIGIRERGQIVVRVKAWLNPVDRGVKAPDYVTDVTMDIQPTGFDPVSERMVNIPVVPRLRAAVRGAVQRAIARGLPDPQGQIDLDPEAEFNRTDTRGLKGPSVRAAEGGMEVS
jgi:hypothetical protein